MGAMLAVTSTMGRLYRLTEILSSTNRSIANIYFCLPEAVVWQRLNAASWGLRPSFGSLYNLNFTARPLARSPKTPFNLLGKMLGHSLG